MDNQGGNKSYHNKQGAKTANSANEEAIRRKTFLNNSDSSLTTNTTDASEYNQNHSNVLIISSKHKIAPIKSDRTGGQIATDQGVTDIENEPNKQRPKIPNMVNITKQITPTTIPAEQEVVTEGSSTKLTRDPASDVSTLNENQVNPNPVLSTDNPNSLAGNQVQPESSRSDPSDHPTEISHLQGGQPKEIPSIPKYIPTTIEQISNTNKGASDTGIKSQYLSEKNPKIEPITQVGQSEQTEETRAGEVLTEIINGKQAGLATESQELNNLTHRDATKGESQTITTPSLAITEISSNQTTNTGVIFDQASLKKFADFYVGDGTEVTPNMADIPKLLKMNN